MSDSRGAAARRRSPAERLTVFLLGAALFAATGGDALGLDRCPHHGVPAGGAAAAPLHDGHAPRPATPPAHAEAGHHQAPHGDSDHGGPCTCMGDCLGGTGAVVAAAAGLAIRDAAPLAGEAEAPAAAHVLPRLDAYLLPYANGPPPGC